MVIHCTWDDHFFNTFNDGISLLFIKIDIFNEFLDWLCCFNDLFYIFLYVIKTSIAACSWVLSELFVQIEASRCTSVIAIMT